jgi:hypothetical protein
MKSIALAAVAFAMSAVFGASFVSAQTTVRPAYGCYKVSAKELSLRETAFKTGNVVATVGKGDILVKRRRFCTLRGTWCPVTTIKGVQGFADKSMIAVAPCPPRLSTKVN